jgi:hypothetical protein
MINSFVGQTKWIFTLIKGIEATFLAKGYLGG